jgi:hypothetical protein
MTESGRDPLEADLAVLISAERRRQAVSPEIKRAVARELEAILGEPVGGDGGAGDPTGGSPDVTPQFGDPTLPSDGGAATASIVESAAASKWLPTLVALVIGGASGAVVHASVAPRAERPPSMLQTTLVDSARWAEPMTARHARRETPAGEQNPTLGIDELPTESVRRSARTPADLTKAAKTADPASEGGKTALGKERTLVERARSALERGDNEAALASLKRHEREYPEGQLREERALLMIQALKRAGHTEAARGQADEFRKSYPHSPFSDAVEALAR